MVYKTDYPLMQVKSTAECSKGSILQYFWPPFNYQLSFKPLFCLFLSGRTVLQNNTQLSIIAWDPLNLQMLPFQITYEVARVLYVFLIC